MSKEQHPNYLLMPSEDEIKSEVRRSWENKEIRYKWFYNITYGMIYRITEEDYNKQKENYPKECLLLELESMPTGEEVHNICKQAIANYKRDLKQKEKIIETPKVTKKKSTTKKKTINKRVGKSKV
jgi:hypothetical protein